jgi:hypothetical protein
VPGGEKCRSVRAGKIRRELKEVLLRNQEARARIKEKARPEVAEALLRHTVDRNPHALSEASAKDVRENSQKLK